MNKILRFINNYKYTRNKKILLKKYGQENSIIDFKNDDILLTIGKKYKSIIPLSKIIDIVYNIDEEGYYFRIKDNSQFFFDRKYDIRYRAKNINNLVHKIKSNDISISPDFGQYGAIYECQYDGIIRYCIANNKFLLTISIDNENILYLNYGTFHRYNYKIITLDNFSVDKEINLDGEIPINKKMHNASYGIYVLDKSLTFDRGYCIVSVDLSGCQNSPNVFGDDIFYSFNEEEIKTKTIELFEKHNK